MKTQQNTNLKQYNTFGVEAVANLLIHIHTINDVLLVLTSYSQPFKILGGGSNVIPTGDIKETILKNEIKGIEVIDESELSCLVKVGGGENWHNFVMWAVHHNLGGIENLALIPGTVGAAPIQNIGAYGVEQEAHFHSATVVDLESGLVKTFYKDDCHFGYRDSVFKNMAKDQYFIADVTYLLKKEYEPVTSYKDIQNYLAEHHVTTPSISTIAKAVIDIRSNKLPDPKEYGNAGSFFKNPVIENSVFNQILKAHPDIVHYPMEGDFTKLSAAWMIDQCGFKGVKEGHTGTYKNQALVLVNYGNATSEEILNFALKVQAKVFDTFGIELEPEVNIWG